MSMNQFPELNHEYEYHVCEYCERSYPDMYDECPTCGTIKKPDSLEPDIPLVCFCVKCRMMI